MQLGILQLSERMMRMRFYKWLETPLGRVILTSDGEALTGIWYDQQKYFPTGVPEESYEANLPIFSIVETWLTRYFNGENPEIDFPLKPEGNAFRQRVWTLLCQIPYGALWTYGDIAKQVASEMGREHMSAQAVGGAVGHNPISVIIPCHRVVGKSGNLTGYAGGIDRKCKLLEIEGHDLHQFKLPKT